MDFLDQLQPIADNFAFYLNIVVLGAVLFGALVGFIRGFWSASFRFVLYAILVAGGFYAMPLVIDMLLDMDASFVPQFGGIQLTTLRELPTQLLVFLPLDGIVVTPELLEIIVEMTSAILALVLFLIYLVVISILIFPIHWILFPLTVGLFFRRKFRKKHKLRLLGAGFGAMQAALSVSIAMLPLAGLDMTVREMDNLDDIPLGELLRKIGSGYGDTVLATILKTIRSTNMPNGLDVGAIDHLLGMTLNNTQTSLRHELHTILLIANELFATGFITSDVELATFIYSAASGSLRGAIDGSTGFAMPTIDTALILANMSPEIAQAIFTILADSPLVVTLIPAVLKTAASLDVVSAYVTPEIIEQLADSIDWAAELEMLGAVAAQAVAMNLHQMGSTPLDPSTLNPAAVETLALAIADSQLIAGALPVAMTTLASSYVPEPYYTDLAIADIDFTQYDWGAELTNIADLAGEALGIYQTLDIENFTINSLLPADVDSILNGIGASGFIMDLFPTMVELGLEMALTQANITDMTIDLSSINWSDELAMLSDTYAQIYAIGEDPLTYNWSTADQEKIDAVNAGIAVLFSSNLLPTVLPVVLEYAVTMIPTEYEGWVDLSLINLEGLTGAEWTEEFQGIFNVYRQLLNNDGTFPEDPMTLLQDTAKVNLIASYLGNSSIVAPLLSNTLQQAVNSIDFSTLLGFPFDASALNFDGVDWATELPLIAEIATTALGIDFADIKSTDVGSLLNLILDSQVFYPALPEIMSGLADSFDLSTALPGVDLSLATLQAISDNNGWQNEVDLLVHVLEIVELNFGGINGVGTFDFPSYLSNTAAPPVIQDLANTMLDSVLFFDAFTTLIIDALEGANITITTDTSTWGATEWKDEVEIVTNLLGVFNDYGVNINDLTSLIEDPNIDNIIIEGLVPAFDSQLLYGLLTTTLKDAITTAGYNLPADINDWDADDWKAEVTILAEIFGGLQDNDVELADLANILDKENVGTIISDVLTDAIPSRLIGPIIKSTIKDAITSATLDLPADIDDWTDAIWAEELGFVGNVLDGINANNLSLSTLNTLTSIPNAGTLIIDVLVPAIDSRLLGDNLTDKLQESLIAANLSMPADIDSWDDEEWKTELTAIGKVLNKAQENDLNINNFVSLLDQDDEGPDVGTILREVVVFMFDSEILGTNAKTTIKDSFNAPPTVTLPADIDSWENGDWKTEVGKLAGVMDVLKTYDVAPSDVGSIMDPPNASSAVEDILLAMMNSQMLKPSVKTVLLETVSSTGFTTPDTSNWEDDDWETEISIIANILRVSEQEELGLSSLNNVELNQSTAPTLGKLMNAVADSALLLPGLNETINDLFNTPEIGAKLSQPISVQAETIDWEVELSHLAFITDNISNLGNTASVTWVDNTEDTLIALRRSAILGSHTETLLVDGFATIGVNDYINTSAANGIVYWIDVAIVRIDVVLPDPEPLSLSLANALTILKDTSSSISGAIPTGGGQAELLLSKINTLHKDYAWIQDGKLTEIVERGLQQANIESFLGVDAALLRPEVVETDDDELQLLGRLMDTIGAVNLSTVNFESGSLTFIRNVLKNIELLEMFKAENPGDPAANVALIERLFDSAPDVQDVLRAEGVIDLAHRENVANIGDPDETVLNDALNIMVGIKDSLANATALTDSQVLKDVRDLETVYLVLVGDDPNTPEPDGTLATKAQTMINGSYFAPYSARMDFSKIYEDDEIELLIDDIIGVKDNLTIGSSTLSSSKATLVSLFTSISNSEFLDEAREDILNDMIDDATARTGSDLVNAELATFAWQNELDAVDTGIGLLDASELSSMNASTIDQLFVAAAPTRILSRIFVDELNDLSTSLNTAPTPSFVWTISMLTPINSRTLGELVSVEALGSITPANYSTLATKISIYDRVIVLGDNLDDEVVGDPYYNRALAANYLPAFITKVTGNTYGAVSKFTTLTNFTRVADEFDEILVAAKAVNTSYGDPINHPLAVAALDGYLATAQDAEIAELSIRIQGIIHLNTTDYNYFSSTYPTFAEMFVLDTLLD